jgi:hypothetical protein
LREPAGIEATVEVLVSYRLRSTGRVVGCPVALPTDADPHHIPMSAVIKCLADYSGVPPEEIELLDLWNEKQRLEAPAAPS